MALDRTWYNTLVDDDGSNTVGTPWNKAAVDSLMDAVDASLVTVPTLPITEADVTNLVADLAAKAPLASPAFTGVPTAPTATAGTDTTQVATTAFVQAEKPVKSLYRNVVPASNVGTAETDLMTYAMPGATMAVDEDTVRIHAYGNFAANANSKTLKVHFGATVVATAVVTANNTGWEIYATVSRTGAATQVAFGAYNGQATGALLTQSTPAATLSGAVTIKITGQSAVGSNDVTCKSFGIEFLPAA